MRRSTVAWLLLFSGGSALVYQLIWTRLLGFVFGTTTEAVATVLAVFFAGMAIGNGLAARWLDRVVRPLQLYGLLELAIGGFALASLPLLRGMSALYGWVGTEHSAAAMAAIRIAAAGCVLLPPTIAMGATLPVVARGLVTRDATMGKWSAVIYGANTLGAVAGAYLCGYWLIPLLGVTRSVLLAAAANFAVGAIVLAAARRWQAPARQESATGGLERPEPDQRAVRATFLAFFGLSGFVAIGYEVVWSKLFSIIMEGTLYGFSAVLAGFLLGIGAGSLAAAPLVDRIRDLPRAFGLLHAGTAAAVAAGMWAIPYLPLAAKRLSGAWPDVDPPHLLLLLSIPIVIVPTALFGAAFPVLIRIFTPKAEAAGAGMGLALAVNTLGSIAASLVLGFWWIPRLGMDSSLLILIVLDLALASAVLLRFQTTGGWGRHAAVATAVAVLALVGASYDGAHADLAIAGRRATPANLADYRQHLRQLAGDQVLVREGKNAIVTVTETSSGRQLWSNGLLEQSFSYAPPHKEIASFLLGVMPYLVAETPESALVIGLGGGNTLSALNRTALARIDVVELEEAVVQGMEALHRGRENPLADPRVRLEINDGRNRLLLGRYRRHSAKAAGHGKAAGDGKAAGYDVIASQPSHPWLLGAANLFTEEFFALARDNLSPGGVFALWVNGFRTDVAAFLSVAGSFDRVFPGAFVVDSSPHQGRVSFLLLGGREPLSLDAGRMSRRVAEPRLRAVLGLYDVEAAEDLLARFEGPVSAFAEIAPEARNTDDNAYVETRIPRLREAQALRFADIERRLVPGTSVMPPITGAVDRERIARALVHTMEGAPIRVLGAKLNRFLSRHADDLDPVVIATLRADARTLTPSSEADAVESLRSLARDHPERPEPWRALGRHLLERRKDLPGAAEAFAEAFARGGDPADAYAAARALETADPEGAWEWIGRIPASARARFPGIAIFDANQALRAGTRGAAVQPIYRALLAYRDSEEGRSRPGINALAAQVASAAGDPHRVRVFQEADRQQRLALGKPFFDRAERALADGRLDEAAAALAQAERTMPGTSQVHYLSARLAVERRDAGALQRALDELRSLAPTLDDAVKAENRFRAEHQLPLLPEVPAP